ncbi:metalloproteinase inhibitor 2-like [Ctenopharyngodon idella]|uniref:metalloproteinase inhibitor 2-like n=1 Tax=Ctenopharyngodon idella TaxID=7959 RepID=UPI00222E524F|nr:metalloproteinase inhibitor 2-like [Ctenopharyngodon idella]
MMGVPLSAALLFLLSVGLKEQVVESCSCVPRHPQEFFCTSDIVMRAEITGEKLIAGDINISGTGEIQYDVKVIKVFKGSDKIKNIKHVYTSEMFSLCGTRLNHDQYLLSGHFHKFFVSMCDFIVPWNKVSLMMKNNLKYRYQMGCDCKIFRCTGEHCLPNTKNECILTGRSSYYSPAGPVHDYACIRHSNGSCSWYTGPATPSGNDTMDVSDV